MSNERPIGRNAVNVLGASGTGQDHSQGRKPLQNASGVVSGGSTPVVGGYRAVILPRPDATVWVQAIGSDLAGMVAWGKAGLAALAGDGVERRVEVRQTVEYVVAEFGLPQGD